MGRHHRGRYDYGFASRPAVNLTAEFLAYQADVRAQAQRLANVPAVVVPPVVVPPVVVPPLEPVPPFGFLFLAYSDGALLTDAAGAFLITPI